MGKYMRAFRECLNDAHRNGKGIEVPHALVMRGAIPIPEEETTQIYLNSPAELAAMYQPGPFQAAPGWTGRGTCSSLGLGRAFASAISRGCDRSM
jgi:hypothetical protein